MPAARVGFIGLGGMGGAMAARLAEAGFEVTGYNRTAERALALAEHGVRLAATPALAAEGADVLMVSLSDDKAVHETLGGAGGALAAAPPGILVADTSTVSPDAARSIAARVAGAGGRALDACVLGNLKHARDGELRFMIGGAAEDVAELRPLLDVLAKDVLHLGGHGMGAAAKVTLNLVMAVELQVLAEAAVFGERAGLDRAQVLEMIAASGYSSPVMRFKAGVMARRSFGRADFRLSLMRKDVLLALDQAQRMGVLMPATDATLDILTMAVNAGLGDQDCAAILSQVERLTPGEA
jgi:3-hydroxyisobutyrate dehydrogenase